MKTRKLSFEWAGALAAGLALSCSTPEPPANPAAAPSASASSSATDVSGAVQQKWSVLDPALAVVIAAATPSCVTRETFLRSPDGFSQSFQVSAPSVPPPVLEKAFRREAEKLGYKVAPRLDKLVFDDEAKHVTGMLSASGGILWVVLGRPPSVHESARKLAAELGFETWSLVESLGEDAWTSLTMERSANSGAGLEAELKLTGEKRAKVEAWAQDKKLPREGSGWLRKLDRSAPSRPSILIETRGADGLWIFEARGGVLSGPACTKAPSSEAREKKSPAAPTNPSDDDLMRQMMGE